MRSLVVGSIVATIAVLAGVGFTMRPAVAAGGDESQPDVRIRVVFFPIAGAPAGSAQDGGAALGRIVSRVNAANPLYFACLQSASPAPRNGANACDASRASIIVSSTLRKRGGDTLTLVVNSVDLSGHRTLGSIRKDLAVIPDSAGNVDDDVAGVALVKALKLTDAEVRSLIGTPVVRDGQLSAMPGFQPFIQLIPDVSSSDPTYVAILQNLLAKRGIASVPSQFNAGTVTSGNVGVDALCGLGQRYLVYSIARRTEDRILSLSTRIETRATGHLYDCPTRSDLAFGDTARTFATNTKQSLAPFLTLLGSLFISKTSSWQNATATGALITNIVDVQPAQIQEHTAEITLQKFVDTFCDRLASLPPPPGAPAVVQQTLPTPAPTPESLIPMVRRSASGPPAGAGANAGGAAAAAVPLDIGNFLADAPPALTCGPPVYGNPPRPAADAPIFNRRP